MLASSNPDTHVKGGSGFGLRGWARIIGANVKFVLRQFANPSLPPLENQDPSGLGCFLAIAAEQQDAGGNIVVGEEELWLVGNAQNYFPCNATEQPTGDEGQFISCTGAPRLYVSYSILMQSLKDSGFKFPNPTAPIGEQLDGICARFIGVAQKDKNGQPKKNKKDFVIEDAIVQEIGATVPWKVAAGAGVAKTIAPTAAVTAPVTAPVDLDGPEFEILMAVLAANEKGIAKAKLFNAVFTEIASNHPELVKQKAAIGARVVSDSYLKAQAEAGRIQFAGGVVKAAA